jgi:hypothetical protein
VYLAPSFTVLLNDDTKVPLAIIILDIEDLAWLKSFNFTDFLEHVGILSKLKSVLLFFVNLLLMLFLAFFGLKRVGVCKVQQSLTLLPVTEPLTASRTLRVSSFSWSSKKDLRKGFRVS